jgi:hypothetical protein
VCHGIGAYLEQPFNRKLIRTYKFEEKSAMYSSLHKIFTPYNGTWLYDQQIKSHPLHLHNCFQIGSLKTETSAEQEGQTEHRETVEMQEENPSNEVAIKNLNVVIAVNDKFLFLLEVHLLVI